MEKIKENMTREGIMDPYKGSPELLFSNHALLRSDLGDLSLQTLALLIGSPNGLHPGLVLPLLLKAEQRHLMHVLLAQLFHLFSIVSPQLGQPAFCLFRVLRCLPAAYEGTGLQELMRLLMVAMMAGGFI